MNKTNPLVSIVIACHNGGKTIDYCMNSLVAQTYDNIEIVVCDDCSTDNSWEKLREWQRRDSRVKLLRNDENLYAAATRNRCIEIVQGEYVAIQDVDDCSELNRIEVLLSVLEKDNIDFVSSSASIFGDDPQTITGVIRLNDGYPKKEAFLKGLPFMHPATMFRTKCLKDVGGYRVAKETRRDQDYDLFMRLYARGYHGRTIAEPLYRYQVDRNNYRRRTFKARLGEIEIRKRNFKALGLMPRGWFYVYRPLLAHVFMHAKLFYSQITDVMKDIITRITPPPITVGIPVHNGEKYLKQAILSVLRQTYTNFELIITDDGSTDKSIEVVKQFDDPRIVLVADGMNKGLPYRLNQQVKMAQGKYFFRMDADDVMFPSRIEEQVAYLDAHEDIDVIGAKSVIIDENSNVIFQSGKGGHAPQTKEDVMNGNLFIHPTVAGKIAWFRANPYDAQKKRSQDYFLWLETVEHSKFALIDKPLIFYRVMQKDILPKFKRDNKLQRQFYWAEFRRGKGMDSLRRWLVQMLRLPAFCSFYAVAGTDGVMRRRYCAVSAEERMSYNAVLNTIV